MHRHREGRAEKKKVNEIIFCDCQHDITKYEKLR